ncbi:MAG: choice-of-anchor D domain-containing protein [Prevotella sp.]|nr:choice-of-anchor D domain-containing protein [Prevotella sp.]
MNIEFTNSYNYRGGNLLIGIYTTTKGTYNRAYFYGDGSLNTSMSRYQYGSTSGNQYFIPKTTFTYEKPVDGPGFKVKGYKTGDSYSFGLVDAGTTATFTLSNPGTESVSVNIATTGGYVADKSSVTIAAKGEATVLVTAANGDGTIVFTPTATGLDAVIVSLSATVKDPSKMFVDFADGKLPDGWTEKGYSSGSGYYSTNYNWAYSAGYAGYSGTSASYAGTLTSPVLDIEAGEKIFIDYARYGSYYTSVLKIETSADGNTWKEAGSIANTDAVYGTWKTLEATAPEAAHYIRITGAYIYITNIYGGSLPKNPVLSFSQDDYDFGFVNEATESTSFTVKNGGGSALTDLQISCDNDAFTISSYPTTIAMGGEVTFTVTMTTNKPGTQTGTVTVSGAGSESTFTVSGFALGEGVFFEDFSSNALPEGWENSTGYEAWTFQDGTAIASTGSNKKMTLPSLTVKAGESMAIRIKKYNSDSWYDPQLYWSVDGGTTKSANLASSLTADYSLLYIEGLEEGNYEITLEGYYVIIDAVGGFKLDENAPKLGLYSDAECQQAISGTTLDADFGFISESESSDLYIRNDGTGTLQLTLGQQPAGFTAQLDNTSLGKKEVAKLTITMPTEGTEGYRSGEISVNTTPDLGSIRIAATGVMRNPDKFYIDFTDQDFAWPDGWDKGDWDIYKSYSNVIYGAEASGDLLTTKLIAAPGDKFLIEALSNGGGYFSSPSFT